VFGRNWAGQGETSMAEGVNTKEHEGGPQGAEPLLAAAALLDEEKTASLSQEDGQYGKKGPGQGGAEMVSKMAEWRGPGCTRRVLGGIEAVCYRGVSLGGLTIGIGTVSCRCRVVWIDGEMNVFTRCAWVLTHMRYVRSCAHISAGCV